MFNHDLWPKLKLDRIDRPEGRIYLDAEGNSYRSVTSVVGQLNKRAIDAWRKRVGAAEADRVSFLASARGSEVHEIAEKFLLNDPEWKKGATYINLAGFKKIAPILRENVGLVRGIEHMMYSKPLKAAGTADLIADWNGVPSIIDFKTSKKLKRDDQILHYYMQLTAYSIMVEEIYGLHVPKIVIVMMVDDHNPLIFEKKSADYLACTREMFGAGLGQRKQLQAI